MKLAQQNFARSFMQKLKPKYRNRRFSEVSNREVSQTASEDLHHKAQKIYFRDLGLSHCWRWKICLNMNNRLKYVVSIASLLSFRMANQKLNKVIIPEIYSSLIIQLFVNVCLSLKENCLTKTFGEIMLPVKRRVLWSLEDQLMFGFVCRQDGF